jgi:citrate synthase
MNTSDSWLGAGDAARLLKVSRPTLYAYVSRGYVRSQPTPGPARDRLYSRDDVDRLRRQTEARRDPDRAAARSLQWGLPVLESSITFVDGKALYYRGHDAVQLSRSRSVAEVASLIWSGQFDGAFSPTPPRIAMTYRPDKTLPFVPRAQAVLALVEDVGAHVLVLLPHEWEVLMMIDATRDLRAIAAALGRSEFEIAKIAYGLVSTGVVELLQD